MAVGGPIHHHVFDAPGLTHGHHDLTVRLTLQAPGDHAASAQARYSMRSLSTSAGSPGSQGMAFQTSRAGGV